MADEYLLWLGSRTNKHGVPYAKGTLGAYRDGVVALDAWMTRESVEGDFTACDTAMLNRFFADYLREHTQGGLNTKQRNLRHFFSWLAREYGHPHPYDDPDLNRYRAAENKPATLAEQFLDDLLQATSGPGFENRRDHAIIRVLMSGVRRTECAQMDLECLDLPNRAARVVPLKGARTRAAAQGRVAFLGDKAALALHRYLRERAHERYASSPLALAGHPRAVEADRQRHLTHAAPPRRPGRLGPAQRAHPHVPAHCLCFVTVSRFFVQPNIQAATALLKAAFQTGVGLGLLRLPRPRRKCNTNATALGECGDKPHLRPRIPGRRRLGRRPHQRVLGQQDGGLQRRRGELVKGQPAGPALAGVDDLGGGALHTRGAEASHVHGRQPGQGAGAGGIDEATNQAVSLPIQGEGQIGKPHQGGPSSLRSQRQLAVGRQRDAVRVQVRCQDVVRQSERVRARPPGLLGRVAAGELLQWSRHDRSDRRLQSSRQLVGDQVVPARLVRPCRSHQQPDMPGQHPPQPLERDHRADRVLVAVETHPAKQAATGSRLDRSLDRGAVGAPEAGPAVHGRR